MKSAAIAVFVTVVLVAATGLTLGTEGQQTLRGEYNWNAGATGDLEAVFTPTGEATWDVAFHFKFRDEPHTYSGKAEGSLNGGKLKGEVQNESKQRTFTFEGKFNKKGKFSGSHAEITGGRNAETGTLSLSR